MTNPEMLTKYSQYCYLRKNGQWPNGIPEWAKGANGLMDDALVKNSVIDELVAHLSDQDKAQEGEKECYRCKGKGVITVGDGYSIDACPICNPAKNETTMKYSDEQIEEIIEWLDAKYARHSEDEDKIGADMLRVWLSERKTMRDNP